MSDKKASSVPKRLTKQLHRSRSVDRQKAARKRAIIRLFRKVFLYFFFKKKGNFVLVEI